MALDRSKGVFEKLLKAFEECRQPNWDETGARETMDHQLMTAQIRVRALDLYEILVQAGPDNLSQP
jgi:hypothetical protein